MVQLPNVSQVIASYLAPLLGLTGLILALITLLAPTLLLHDKVVFFAIRPFSVSDPSKSVDGPSVFMGILGSCAQAKNGATIECTPATASPAYDLSLLPSNAPGAFFTSPGTLIWLLMAVTIALMFVFLVVYTGYTFSKRLGKFGAMIGKPSSYRLLIWTGVLALLIGSLPLLMLRLWYGKAIEDFNLAVAIQDTPPDLHASNGNAFIMLLLAYIFFFVPVICSITRLNIKASTGKWAV